MKSIWKKIFVIAFFIICLVPVGCMKFVESSLDENRNLSEFPQWQSEEGEWNKDLFNELSTYVAEHFAFRGQLVELDGRIKYKLFHSPSNEQVVLGKNGWMYFDATLNDYGGVTLGEKIDNIADNLSMVCDYIEEMGKKPLILIAPNKSSVYPENMPARFGEPATETNLSLLQQALEQRNVPYVDARQVLRDYKGNDEVYLHYDTHWNDTGARLVMNKVYEAWGTGDSHDLDNYEIEAIHEPDLYKLLFPTDDYLENQHVYPDRGVNYSYKGRMRSFDDLTIKTEADEGNGYSVLVFRDSFGRAMIPYMSSVFSQCTYNRSTPYDMGMLEKVDCDYVLIEIVERNIKDLGDITIE